MASTSKINSLKMAAEIALVKLQGKRYFAGDLSNRLQKTADEYRQDTVLQAMSRVVENIAVKNPESQAFLALLSKALKKPVKVGIAFDVASDGSTFPTKNEFQAFKILDCCSGENLSFD